MAPSSLPPLQSQKVWGLTTFTLTGLFTNTEYSIQMGSQTSLEPALCRAGISYGLPGDVFRETSEQRKSYSVLNNFSFDLKFFDYNSPTRASGDSIHCLRQSFYQPSFGSHRRSTGVGRLPSSLSRLTNRDIDSLSFISCKICIFSTDIYRIRATQRIGATLCQHANPAWGFLRSGAFV